ncbi:MAG TPA: cupredoxin family copper-binding protein [Gemmataceae bacterium]|nr:cupredoxin family copper-binding protein [Gemmataceae bacterium]
MRSVTMVMLLGVLVWTSVDTSSASAQLLRRRRHNECGCAATACNSCGGGYGYGGSGYAIGCGCGYGQGGYMMAGPYSGQPGGMYSSAYSPMGPGMANPLGNEPRAMPNPPTFGSTVPNTPTFGSTAPQANAVSITDGSFAPETVRVAPGTTVKWTNNGQKMHTVTPNDGSWDSGNIAPGQSYTRTFSKAGTFSYKCSLHPQKMEGKVIVEQSGTSPNVPGE